VHPLCFQANSSITAELDYMSDLVSLKLCQVPFWFGNIAIFICMFDRKICTKVLMGTINGLTAKLLEQHLFFYQVV
jgi:hypothetical protein